MVADFSQLDLKKQYTYADYLTWTFDDQIELFIPGCDVDLNEVFRK